MGSSTEVSSAFGTNLPKKTLEKVKLGQSFAEYDRTLVRPSVFVETPAFKAALDETQDKCFFVGRRGTGKTAITLLVNQHKDKKATIILPQIFAPLGDYFELERLQDTRQRYFKSLVSSFKRALFCELLNIWLTRGLLKLDKCSMSIQREEELIKTDFDERLLTYVENIFDALDKSENHKWLNEINLTKDIGNEISSLRQGKDWDHTVMIDRVDESWDGSRKAVVVLMGLMHACVEINSSVTCLKPLLFLRENMFDRVRDLDNEFARLETFVVSLEWSHELLLEIIERRLNLALNSNLPLKGPTWDAFFENFNGTSSRFAVFDFCQNRPRDVLTYCSSAIESAQLRRQNRVTIEDLQAARRSFSESRLKDLGDEYAENYPQIQLILSRFYGLGKIFTVNGINDFIKKLLVDEEVKTNCQEWIYSYTSPELFIKLLYRIGFIGLKNHGEVIFRSIGAPASGPLQMTEHTSLVVHPSYAYALNLRDIVINSLDDSVALQKSGFLVDLPDAISLEDFRDKLQQIQDNLKTLPLGKKHDSVYEDVVGDIIRLCFFQALSNIEDQVRDVDGRVRRDWIASNHAPSGFWEMVRARYNATQVIWECKNYSDLKASDFQQAEYYMNREIGNFVVLTFRGEVKKHYYDHVKRIATSKDGIVLLLTDKDLLVFVRQAISGKERENHIREIYDRTVRAIS